MAGLMLWRSGGFRALWAGAALSQLATPMLRFALPLIAVAELGAGPWQIAVISALGTLAFLLVGLPAGVLADRVRQRRLLIWTDVGRAVLTAAVAVTTVAGLLGTGQLYLLALAVGVLAVLFDVTHPSYLPQLVDRTQLVAANGWLTAVLAIGQLVGPALAGALHAVLRAPGVLAVIAGGFAASALCLLMITQPDRVPEAPERRALGTEIAEGVRYVFGDPLLRPIVLAGALINLCTLVIQAIVLIYLVTDLRLTPEAAGLLFSAGGAGGILGALVAEPLARRVGRIRLLSRVMLVCGPFALLIPGAGPGQLALACAGYAMLWAGCSIFNVVQISVRQETCPPGMLGRMNATFRFTLWGVMPLGGFLGGALATATGVRTTLWLGAAGITLAALPVFTLHRRKNTVLPEH
ncbi:MAG TPA: MFS transporter [Actinophytocola sp.]|uniref:MFS transporter n=1 Tax=Actinophytocola sp. TaxID=1872138 RepID=UPI002DFF8B82|nr:MFS transporter [Actinophytocola sp.]